MNNTRGVNWPLILILGIPFVAQTISLVHGTDRIVGFIMVPYLIGLAVFLAYRVFKNLTRNHR